MDSSGSVRQDIATRVPFLANYLTITHSGMVGWFCRRCVLVHIDATLAEDDDEVVQRGMTLDDLVRSAEEHECVRHGRTAKLAAS